MSEVSNNFETGVSYLLSNEAYIEYIHSPDHVLVGRPDGHVGFKGDGSVDSNIKHNL